MWYTKEESVRILKSMGDNKDELSPFIRELYEKFGWTLFLNGSIPLYGGERKINEFASGREIKKALVVRANRGVSTAIISRYAESVIAIDTVKADTFDRLMESLKIKNVSFIQTNTRSDFDKYISSGEYDFIYLEIGIELNSLSGYEKLDDNVFIKEESDNNTELNAVFEDQVEETITDKEEEISTENIDVKVKRKRRTKKEMLESNED